MTLVVQVFAGAAARLGDRLELAVEPPVAAGAVREALAAAYPDHAALLARCSLAVDGEVAEAATTVPPGAEVALLPPFAGGSAAPRAFVDVCAPPLPTAEALAAIADPKAGAQVVFLGTVRDHSASEPAVQRLEYSAYDAMARKVLAELVEEAAAKWPELRGVALVHAVGALEIGQPTILVACSAPHRDVAYAANRHLLEQVKTRVPVWKREVGASGVRWIGLDDHDH